MLLRVSLKRTLEPALPIIGWLALTNVPSWIAKMEFCHMSQRPWRLQPWRPTWQPSMTNELLSQWVNSHRIFLDDDDDDDDDEQEGVKTAATATVPAACHGPPNWLRPKECLSFVQRLLGGGLCENRKTTKIMLLFFVTLVLITFS